MEGNDYHERSPSIAPLLPYDDPSYPSTPSKSSFRTSRRGARVYVPALTQYRRRVFVIAVVVVVALGFFVSTLLARSQRNAKSKDAHQDLSTIPTTPHPSGTNTTVPVTPPSPGNPKQEPQYSQFLVGKATQSFRDNLRPEYAYITTWTSAGWNNDVMTHFNLIYLAMITERIPVIGPFIPMHVGPDAGYISFGEIFDVERFVQNTDHPLLEWWEVKDRDSNVIDEVGCWNVWEAVQYGDHNPRKSTVPEILNIDISYTKTPDWVKIIPGYEHDPGASFWQLARLAFPEDRDKNLAAEDKIRPSPLHGAKLDPDEHMLCYDYLYYVGAVATWEYDFGYSPAWRFVGKYLRFTDQVQELVRHYVNRLFNLPEHAPLPAYITVHVRHGDFKDWCWDAEKPEDCFAPIPVIARRVREVQDELSERRFINIPNTRVIVTSDETDPAWWQEIEALRWVRVDHDQLNTVQRHGKWYPTILDSAIQASGLGFVGTDRSTFSILSRRRVLDWQDGAARMVLWGRKGADDH